MSRDSKLPAIVALPWAHPAFERESSTASDSDRVAEEARALHVDAAQLHVGDPPKALAHIEARSPHRTRALPPDLRARGLPHEPWPSVPEEDRQPLDMEALMSAAVALDLLTTRTKHLDARATILSDIVVTALSVGAEAGLDTEGHTELVAVAAGPVGFTREQLGQRFQDSSRGADSDVLLVPSSTPNGVAKALRRLENGGASVVREACLLLDAWYETDYRSV